MEPPIVSTNHQPFLKTQPDDPPPPKFQPPLIATFILLIVIGAIIGFIFANSLLR